MDITYLRLLLYQKLTRLCNLGDSNHFFECFFEKLDKLIAKLVPFKVSLKNNWWQTLTSHGWITKGIKKSIGSRDRLLKISKKTIQNRRVTVYHQYTTFCNRLVSLVRQCKSNYFKSFIRKNLKNSKQIWKRINQLIVPRESKNNGKIRK